MFETEAKEYAKDCEKQFHTSYGACLHSFKDGAEFGYNKANEWHYVKDGDLPKEEGLFVVYWRLGKIDGYTIVNSFKKPHKDIVAWYEIPKFEEEK